MARPSRPSLWFPVVLALGILSGCTVNSDIMFKTPNDYEFDVFTDTANTLFRIQPNDALEMRLFANDGYKMIDFISEGSARELMMAQRMIFTYNVEYDGLVKLPLLGRVSIAGMTLREAEMMLEDRYSEFYIRPFIQVTVNNRRVVIFNGQAGMARVIPLENNNTTLMEALSEAGGLAPRGQARNVKLFRKDIASGQRKVYHFDMSTIEGLPYADIVLEGDDIVYVQPNQELAREALSDLNPLIALLTTTLLILGIVRGFQ